MKNRLTKTIYQGNVSYRNKNNESHGIFKRFDYGGNIILDGRDFNDKEVGLWKVWHNSNRQYINTWNGKYQINGITINFNYEDQKTIL